MSALPDGTAVTSETAPAGSRKVPGTRRTLAIAAIGVVWPVVAFWVRRWWLLPLVVPALIGAKVFLVMAGVPWWLVAVVAAALFAGKTVLIVRHSRQAATPGRWLDT